MDRTREFALASGQVAPISIQLIKRAVYQSRDADLATSLDLISSHMMAARHAEPRGSIAAREKKREGVYQGN